MKIETAFDKDATNVSDEDLLTLTGRVTELSDGVYHLLLENGLWVNARLCGKMRKGNLKIVVGDFVSVVFSQYDTGGIIFKRLDSIKT